MSGSHPLKGRKQTPEHVAKRVAAIRNSGYYESDKFREDIARAMIWQGGLDGPPCLNGRSLDGGV